LRRSTFTQVRSIQSRKQAQPARLPCGSKQSFEIAAAVLRHALDRCYHSSGALGIDGSRVQPGFEAFASLVGNMTFEMTWKSGLVLLAWSVVDYMLTLQKMNSDMKMTKQEVRQEYKETDGNPLIKSRIRQIQRNMRKRQSLKAAATATVIVTNPTHYAVALKYEADMAAPIVVAKASMCWRKDQTTGTRQRNHAG